MSDKKNDGGAAFPCEQYDSEFGNVRKLRGMSLRDWLAGQALAGLLADPNETASENVVAFACYSYADAILKEREQSCKR